MTLLVAQTGLTEASSRRMDFLGSLTSRVRKRTRGRGPSSRHATPANDECGIDPRYLVTRILDATTDWSSTVTVMVSPTLRSANVAALLLIKIAEDTALTFHTAGGL